MIIGIVLISWGVVTIFLSHNSSYVKFVATIIDSLSGIGAMGSADYFSKKEKFSLAKILIRVFSAFFIIIGAVIIFYFIQN